MATLILTSLVSAAGLSGFTAFAATLAATAVGGLIDNALFGQNFEQEGPRLTELQVSTSSEGSPIKRLFGRSRVAGNVIWATNFNETKTTETQGGGKGGGGSSVTTTTYNYSLSFAVAFCEGNERTTLGRVWADGKLLDTEGLDVTFYPGSDTQSPDPTMQGIEGSDNVPAYRGMAYMVFKDMPLADVGNRIPSITAEIIKPLDVPDTDSIEELIEGMNLIPASGEAAYATTPTVRDDGFGNALPENVNLSLSQSNIENSIDNMTKQLPNNSGMNLVVSWFGTDLRASDCEFKPKVELKTGRQLLPNSWQVNGLTRSSATVEAVSTVDGDPAFGGTPADFSIVEAIKHLGDDQGQDVYFYPFILMDIEEGNTLPDTDTGAAGQPVYPWRGRITTSLPAVDKTASAQTEVDSLFGSVSASDFSISGTTVNYTGSSSDFGYRRMILHYAHLCAAAANSMTTPAKLKAFYIGTELRGITRIRSSSTNYPGVNALVTLLQDVRAVFDAEGLTGVELSYAADWSEYHSHRPDDGSGDVHFNLDPIWSHADCDYVAIDNYMPLSDWRDGTAHADYGTGNDTYGNPKATSIYDKDYLQGQIEGGEEYDYYYASDADRTSQTRTAIADSVYGQDWRYGQKYIREWWSNQHHDMTGNLTPSLAGTNDDTPDAWTATSVTIASDANTYGPYSNAATFANTTGSSSDVGRTNSAGDGIVSGETYEFGVIFKAGTSNELRAYVGVGGMTNPQIRVTNIATGNLTFESATIDSSTLTDLGSGFWRVDATFTATVTDRTTPISVGPNTTTIGEDVIVLGSWLRCTSEASGASTDWEQGSKKIVFSEMGAPAIDKATNQPNVFFDLKSSESFFPYHSSGNRDDFIQRLYYEALIAYWRDNSPTSPITMIDPTDMFAWTWDARPYPAFPYRSDLWSDGPNYRLGHWLNGRVGVLTLGQLVREICLLGGLEESDIDVTGLVNSAAIVRGYVVDQLSSPRDMLAPLSNAFLFDGFESSGQVKFVLKSNTVFTDITEDDLVIQGEDVGGYSLTRTQETELPAASTVSFIDEAKDYQVGSVGGVRLVGSSRNVVDRRFPIVLTEEYARSLSEVLIQQEWSARERGEFILPPSYLALDPSDGITITVGGREINHLIGRIDRGSELTMNTASHDISVFETLTFATTGNFTGDIPVFGQTILYVMDLPLVNGEEPQPWSPRLIAYQSPFPASVDFYRDESGSYTLNQQLILAGVIGETTATLASGDPWRFDSTNTLSVKLYDPTATLLSATKTEVLNGANAVAVQTSSGSWEVIQFTTATLTGTSGEGLPLYDLDVLLRGQLGTETEIEASLASGAKFVVLQLEAINYIDLPQGQKTFDLDYRYGPAGVEITSAIYQDVSHTGTAAGLLPYAPVSLKKTPTAASTEVTFTWKRRTRFGGDDFEEEVTPLNEENERYDLEIYDPSGPTLLRTVSDLTSPTYTYTTAEQSADGGALDSYTIRVWQKSTSIGRGRMAEETL